MANLPGNLREVVILRFFEGAKHEEMAAQLGVAEATVRYRLKKALEELRTSLREKGIASSSGWLIGLLEIHARKGIPSSSLMPALARDVLAQAAAGAPNLAAPIIGGAIMAKKIGIAATVIALVCLGAMLKGMLPGKVEDGPESGPASGQEAPGAAGAPQEALAEGANAAEKPIEPAAVDGEASAGPGRISGRVVLAESQVPVPEYRMRVERYEGVHPLGRYRPLSRVTTDAAGRFTVESPAPGLYWFAPEDTMLAPEKPGGCRVRIERPGQVRDDVIISVEAGGALAGRVYDQASGRGVGKVDVTFECGRLNVFTDERGHYEIAGLRAGTHEIALHNTGEYINDARRGLSARSITVAEGKCATLDFPLAKGIAARGQVVDGERQPIADAYIRLMPVAPKGDGRDSYAFARSQPDGRFVLSGQPGGVPLNLEIGSPREGPDEAGFTVYRETVDLASWRGERIFVLQQGGLLEGRVLDAASGQAVTSFEVALMLKEEASAHAAPAFSAEQNEEGRFALHAPGTGPIAVLVRADGYATAERGVASIVPGQTLPIEVALVRACRLLGRVLDEEGGPIAGAVLTVGAAEFEPAPAGAETSAKSDAEGRFAIDHLGEGSYTIQAAREGFQPGQEPVRLQRGISKEIELVLRRGGIVSGTITLDGAPAAGAPIAIEAAHGHFSAISGSDGGYQISGLPWCAADVRARLEAGGEKREMRRTAEITEGVDLVVDFDFTSATAIIEGAVLVAGQPAVESVHLSATGAGGEEAYARAEKGRFRFERAPVGRVMVRAQFRGGGLEGRAFRREIETAAGEVTQCNISIDISQGTTLRGTVEGFEPGRARYHLLGGHLDLSGPDDLRNLMEGTVTDVDLVACEQPISEEGAFELPGVEPGAYTLLITGRRTDRDRGVIIEHIEVGEGDMEVNLGPE